jgi:pilus assembly protein FimV
MFRKMILVSAVSLALAPSGVVALGLGELTSNSALNQPFLAEIELVNAVPEALDTVKASLASEAEFDKVGAERLFFLTKLRFNPQISEDGRTVLRVTSREPIREPFMDFLVEVTWPEGRLVREYTVLLDPPVKGAEVSRPRIGRPAAAPPGQVRESPATSDVIEVPAAAQQVAFPIVSDPVPSGAGLLRVARSLSPAGATVAQTAMALYRSNQSAFIGGDINGLRAGVTLTLPSAAELFAVTADEAQRRLSLALSGRPVARAPLAPVAETAFAESAARPTTEGGRLRIAAMGQDTEGTSQISSAAVEGAVVVRGEGGTGQAPVEEELLLIRETSESTRQETVELQARLRQLEAQLADIQSLLALRNEELAELRLAEALEAETGQREDVAAERPLASADESTMSEAGAEAAVAQPTQADPSSPTTADPEEAASDVTAGSGAATAASSQPAASESDGAETPSSGDALEGAESPPAAEGEVGREIAEASTAPETAQAGGGGLRSAIGIGIAIIALLGGAALYLARRRRRLANSLQIDSDFAVPAGESATPPELQATAPPVQKDAPRQESVAIEDVAGDVDSDLDDEDDVAIATPEVVSSRPFDDDSDVDVFSEADIYIAYGRYREAEALLQDEIARSPGRLDLQFKLAEALYGMKNYDSFISLLGKMRAAGADEASPEQWRRLSAMQASLQQAPQETAQDKTPRSGESPRQNAPPRPGPAAKAAPPVSDSPASEGVARPLGGAAQGASATVGRGGPRPALDDVAVETPKEGRAETRGESSDKARPAATRRAEGGGFADLDLDLDNLVGSVSDHDIGGGAAAEVPAYGPVAKAPTDEADEDSGVRFDLRDEELRGSGPGLRLTSDAESADPRDRDAQAPGSGLQGLSTGRVKSKLASPDLDDQRERALDLDLDDLVTSVESLGRAAQSGRSTADRGRSIAHTGSHDGPSQASARSDMSDSLFSDFRSTSQHPGDSSGLWDEAATKLDLARAYIEMKDAEAARTILEEVAEEGDEGQREEARLLLRELA